MDQAGSPKNVKVSGAIEARLSPEFTKEYKAGQEQEHTRENHRFRVEIATLVVIFVYTLLAFWQGCSNSKAANAAKDAADVAKLSLESAQRAYIHFSPHVTPMQTIAHIGQSSEKIGVCCWQFEVPITNEGETPPRDVQGHVQAIYSPTELSANYPFKDFEKGDLIVIGVKDTTTIVTSLVTSGEALKTYQLQGFIYLFGWVTYHDVFPNTPLHRTKFCFKVFFADDPTRPEKIPATHYFLTPFHNCADEQCSAQQ